MENYYTIDYLESKIREAKSDGDDGIELDVDILDISDSEVVDLVNKLGDYDKTVIFENLIADGFALNGDENPAFDAIETLRHKLTTLALYPDMTALDVLDYIEEAIK